MSDYENLRHKLRVKRKEKDLNQRQLAQRMGVHTTALNNLETGGRENPTIQTLADWAASLGGRLVIDVEFPEEFKPRVTAGGACRLESPGAVKKCECANWRQCYLNEQAA